MLHTAPRTIRAMLRQSRRRLSSCAYSLATDRWIDEAIIGLNLCPYTKAVRKRAAVRTRICNSAIDEATLLKEIDAEATLLQQHHLFEELQM